MSATEQMKNSRQSFTTVEDFVTNIFRKTPRMAYSNELIL